MQREESEAVELAVRLEAIDLECELNGEWAGTARVGWSVEGGQAPYEVWVNGDLQVGESGIVQVPCIGLRWVDFLRWERIQEDLPLTVVGGVIDAVGVRASDLLLIKRPPWEFGSPENSTKSFEGGVDALNLELFAPRICEAHDWSWYYRLPFAGTGGDDVGMDLEWQVSGGEPPYTVYLAGGEFTGETGSVRVQCRSIQDGVLDSGWISAMGLARDSDGAMGSAVVQTYALARSSSTREVELLSLNGGKTYRFEGILMSIPEGLTIDLSEGFESLIVECEAGDTDCESFFWVWTQDRTVKAVFGYESRRMLRFTSIRPEWAEDRGIEAGSLRELNEVIDAWADSVGQPPDLSGARWLNPPPLRISGFADPIICDPIDQIGRVYITVAGGGWTPTGVEVDGKLVGLARGSGVLAAYPDCSEPAGTRTLRLNVHDLGPETDTSIAETDVEMQFPPLRHGEGVLKLGTDLKYGSKLFAFDPTAYCAPGSKARITWNLRSAVDPVEVQVNMMPVDAADGVWLDGWYATSGELWIDCQQELGTQIVTIGATDSSDPPQVVELAVPLQIVKEHPSGLDWSEIRPDDYPE